MAGRWPFLAVKRVEAVHNFCHAGSAEPCLNHMDHESLDAAGVYTCQSSYLDLDSKPVELDQYILSALPNIRVTLASEKCLKPEMRAVYSYLQAVANSRVEDID